MPNSMLLTLLDFSLLAPVTEFALITLATSILFIPEVGTGRALPDCMCLLSVHRGFIILDCFLHVRIRNRGRGRYAVSCSGLHCCCCLHQTQIQT